MFKLRRRLKTRKYHTADDQHRPHSGAVNIQLVELSRDEDSSHYVNTEGESPEIRHDYETIGQAKCKH